MRALAVWDDVLTVGRDPASLHLIADWPGLVWGRKSRIATGGLGLCLSEPLDELLVAQPRQVLAVHRGLMLVGTPQAIPDPEQ